MDSLLIVRDAAGEDIGETLLLEFELELGPDPLNRVIFWAIGNVEDCRDAVLLLESLHLLAVMHPAVV